MTRLQRLMAAHDEVTARGSTYELDVAKLIAFPAMSDGRQPLTAAFLRAKKVADGLRPRRRARQDSTQDPLAEYRDAVDDYEVAFDVAEQRCAADQATRRFTEVERKRLDTAKQLLSVAIDQAATPAERQLAYRRVRQELDGLISLSDEAVEVLEKKVALELTTGPRAAPRRIRPDRRAPPRAPAATAPRPPPRRAAPPPASARPRPARPGAAARSRGRPLPSPRVRRRDHRRPEPRVAPPRSPHPSIARARLAERARRVPVDSRLGSVVS